MLKKVQTKIYIAIGGVLFLLFFVLFAVQQEYAKYTSESPLYQLESAYRIDGEPWAVPETMIYAEDSAEALFLQGMELFDKEEYASAEQLFEQALSAEGKDVALPTYLRYYLNACSYHLEGESDFALVSEIFDTAAKYSPLANDNALFWELVDTVCFSPEKDQKMIALMQEYLQTTPNLNLKMRAWLKNCIGMLQYNNKEYANAIRNFYDVELMLTDVDLTATADAAATKEEIGLAGELRYAKEYIANIYYIFEDYKQAAALYRELVETAVEDTVFNEYGSCINMVNVCLDDNDIKGAKKALTLLERGLPNIVAGDRKEVEAHKWDGLANICMKEGKYAEADLYLKKAEAYYVEHTDSAFLGGQYFIQLSRGKYMVYNGQLTEAQTLLEKMNKSGVTEYYSLEKEVYKLLKEIYKKTGQTEKLIDAYQYLQDYDEEFTQTVQREYLEFSKYYRENNKLKEYTVKLSNDKKITMGIAVGIFCILLLALFVAYLLNTKNLTDQLTGVYNRKKLNRLLQKYQKIGTPANLGVVMLDIDFFKRYNDTYGHPAGDMVLKEVAQILKSSVRKEDIVIRYGGEEFLILLSNVQADQAKKICERIRNHVTERGIVHEASLIAKYVTISTGVCHQQMKNGAELEILIAKADECLYQSKENGRNCVTLKAEK